MLVEFNSVTCWWGPSEAIALLFLCKVCEILMGRAS